MFRQLLIKDDNILMKINKNPPKLIIIAATETQI